jgi:tRNA(Ile)-lysidine synthase TilS/MesJ
VSKQIFSKFQNFCSVLIYGSLNEILVVTLVGHGLDDQTEGFFDFEQGLYWTFRMARYEGKRKIAEGLT